MKFSRRTIYLCLPLFFLISLSLSGNPTKVDSMLQKIQSPVDDTLKVKALNGLCYALYMDHPDSAFKYASRALHLAKKLKWKKGISGALTFLGMVYSVWGDEVKSLQYYFESMKVMDEIGDKAGMAVTYHNIGKIYLDLHNYPEALRYYKRCLDLRKEIGDHPGIASSYINIALIYDWQEIYPTALQYIHKAVEMCKQYGLNEKLMIALHNQGVIYFNSGKREKGLALSKQALELSKAYKAKFFTAAVYYAIGQCYVEMKDTKNAIRYLQEGLEVADALGAKEYQKLIHENLAAAYENSGNPKAALSSYKKFVAYKDSVNREDAARHLAELEARYNNEKLQQKMNLLSKQHLIQSLKLKNKNYLLAGLAIVCVLSIVLTVLAIRHTRLRNRQKTMLLEQQVLRAQINPHFLFNALNSIQKYIAKGDSSKAHEYIARFSSLMRAVLNNSNKTFIPLRDELASVQLYLDIEQMRVNHEFDYSIDIDPNIETDTILMPAMLIQPYVENAIWHGLMPKDSRGELKINVGQESDTITFSIEDNGIGRAKAAETRNHNGNDDRPSGMKLVKDRIDVINAMGDTRLDVSVTDKYENNTPQGTRVVISMEVKT